MEWLHLTMNAMSVSLVCVDTSTFVYAHTEQDDEKKVACLDWLVALTNRELQRSSLQVANEFSNVLLRKMKAVPSVVVYRLADGIIEMGGFNAGISTIRLCRDVKHETSYSYWDCLLLASAVELGCSHFLSEDMQAGRTVMGVTIINPMVTSPQEILGLN